MIALGIKFDGIHSFHDLDLYLSKDGVQIPPAPPKTNYIDLSGGHGSLDLTESHGEVKYGDREGCKFTFTMNPAGDLSDSAFEAKKTEVSNALNGKLFKKITLDKDPYYYYTGRCTVSEYLSDKRHRRIVVTAKLQPYKQKQSKTVATYALTSEEQTVVLTNKKKSVVPEITCTDDNTKVVFGSGEFMLSAGTHKILDVCLTEGHNILKVSGSGTITFTYQEAEL